MYFIREFFVLLSRRICTLFLLLLCSFSVYAQQNMQMPVTLSASNKTLKEVFKALEQKTGFTINYQDNVINTNQKVSIEARQQPLAVVLQQLLNGSTATFKQQGNMILLFKKPATPISPEKAGKVTGKIIDEETGQPVIGATIRIAGTGTTTGIDGSFSLALPGGSYTATVSNIGYGTKEINEITIKDNQAFVVNMTLKRKKGQLADVIVKASASKESIASFYTRQKNAATVTDGISFEQLNKLPDNNVGAALKRISGVSVVDNKYVVVRGMTEYRRFWRLCRLRYRETSAHYFWWLCPV